MSELTDILRDTVYRLFGDFVTRELLEKADRGAWPAALWDALAENGLIHPLVPEDRGGVGAGFEDTYEIVYAAGYHAAPVPLPETVLASWLAASAGLDIPEGPLTVLETRDEAPLKLTRKGDAWHLNGRAPKTPWGADASHLVTVADAGGELRVAVLKQNAGTATRDRNMAHEPRDTLTFNDAPAVSVGEHSLPPNFSRDTVTLYGAMFRAAQIAGAAQRVLDSTVDYALERNAFGRPIAKFQAIQQQLASLAAHIAQATMAAETAFRAADEGDPRFEIAVAKTVAGQTATLAAETGHQVHGAIGFTLEHALNFSTRRLWCWRAEYGSDSRWAEELGRRAAGRGADMLWSDLTERSA